MREGDGSGCQARGADGRIRTRHKRFRRPLLYPSELRLHVAVLRPIPAKSAAPPLEGCRRVCQFLRWCRQQASHLYVPGSRSCDSASYRAASNVFPPYLHVGTGGLATRRCFSIVRAMHHDADGADLGSPTGAIDGTRTRTVCLEGKPSAIDLLPHRPGCPRQINLLPFRIPQRPASACIRPAACTDPPG